MSWKLLKRLSDKNPPDGKEENLADEKITAEIPAYAFSGKAVEQALVNKITAKVKPAPAIETPAEPKTPEGRSVNELMERLNLLKY